MGGGKTTDYVFNKDQKYIQIAKSSPDSKSVD